MPLKTGAVWPRLWPLAVLALATALFWFGGFSRYLSFDQLVMQFSRLAAYVAHERLAAMLTFVGLYALIVALSVPGATLLTISGGLLFGTLTGGILSVIAASIGAVFVFFLVRYALGDLVRAKLETRLSVLASRIERHGFWALLSLRLMPVFPFWLINLAAGCLKVRARHFVLATFFGIMPAGFAFASLGGGLLSVVKAAKSQRDTCLSQGGSAESCAATLDMTLLVRPELLLSLTMLGCVAALPIIVSLWRDRRFDAS